MFPWCQHSTCVNDGTVIIKRAGKDREIPHVVDFYNQHMEWVDKSDQMLTSYEIQRKRIKKWYKKVFHHLVNQSIFNAHIIHMHLDDSDKLTPLKFREKLVTDIAVKYATPTTSSRHGRVGKENNELWLIGQHFPAYVENTDNSNLKKWKNIRRCVVCHKHGICKEICFICKQCDWGLCAVPCFENYHTLKN